MTFGNPAYLKALPLLLLPILLHLFFPRKRRIVVFAPFMLLSASQRHPAIRRRLRELLLLLLRMLAIAAAVLALSRPHLRSVTLANNFEAGAAIILDDSMSMQRTQTGGGTAFKQARESALALLNALPDDCQTCLVFTSSAPGLPLTSDRDAMRALIDNAEVTGCGGNLQETLTVAAEQLKDITPGSRQYFVISDFQETALPAGGVNTIADSHVYALSLATKGGNVALGTADTDIFPKTVGRPFHIKTRISNYGNLPRDLHISLEINGMTQNEQTISIPAEDSAVADFTYTPTTAGELEGRLVVDDDEIPFDNSTPFVLRVMDTVPTLLLSEANGAASPLNYLRQALERLPSQADAGGFQVDSATLNEAAMLSFDEYRLIAMAPSQDTPPTLAGRLQRFVKDGGRILLFPGTGPEGEDGGFYDAFAQLAGTPIYKADAAARDGESGMECFDVMSLWNTLLELDLINWNGLLTPAVENAQILAINGNGALIVRRTIGDGAALVFAMRPSRNGGNWPELKSFPVMMIALANNIIGNDGKTIQLECGQSIDIPNDGDTPEVIMADGHAATLTNSRWAGSRIPQVTRFRKARIDCAITTPPANESDTECLERIEIEKRLGTKVTWLDAGRDPTEQLLNIQAGTDMTGLLLTLAVLAIAAEFFLGMSIVKKRNALNNK